MDYHDVLALYGAGSAHPGGFKVTLEWLAGLQLPSSARVLEVGCGTGRTACELAKTFNVEVIGVDLRETMIEKAKKRANALGCSANFMLIDQPLELPFPDGQFDLVVAESVSIFNDVQILIEEYLRVLRPGGKVVDTEMAAAFALPEEILHEVYDLYGARQVPTLKKWKTYFENAGFVNVRILNSGPVKQEVTDFEHADLLTVVSPEAYLQTATAIVEHNQRFMSAQAKWFAYGVFSAEKNC